MSGTTDSQFRFRRVSIANAIFLFVLIITLTFKSTVVKAQGIRCEPSNLNLTGCEKFLNEICLPRIDNDWECDCESGFTRDVANRTFNCLEIKSSYKLSVHFPKLKYSKDYKNKVTPMFMEFQAEIWFKILNYLYTENIPMISIDLISAIKWKEHTTVAILKFMLHQDYHDSALLKAMNSYFTANVEDKKFGNAKIVSIAVDTDPKQCLMGRDKSARCADPNEMCDSNSNKCLCRMGKTRNGQNGICQDIERQMNFIMSIPNIPYDSNFLSAGNFVVESQLFSIITHQYPDVISLKLNSVIPGTKGILAEFSVFLSQNITVQDMRNAIEAAMRENTNLDNLSESIVFWVEDLTLSCSINECPIDSVCVITKGRKICQCHGKKIANSYSGQCEDSLHIYTALIDFSIPYLSSYMDPYSDHFYTLAKSIEMEIYSMLSLNDTSYHAVKVQTIFPGIKGTFLKIKLYSTFHYPASDIKKYLSFVADSYNLENNTFLVSSASLLRSANILDITDEKEDEDQNCDLDTNEGCNISKRFVCISIDNRVNRCRCPVGLVKNFVTKECEVPHSKFYIELLLQIPWSQAYQDTTNDQYKFLTQKFENEFFAKLLEKEANLISINLDSIMPSAFFDINNEFLSFIGFSVYFNKFIGDSPPSELRGAFEKVVKLALKDTYPKNLLFKNSQLMSLEGSYKNCVPSFDDKNVCQATEICSSEDNTCECQVGYDKNYLTDICEKINSQYQVLLTLDIPFIKSFASPRTSDFKTLARILETELNRHLSEKSKYAYINCDIDNMIPLGTEHLIVSSILSFKTGMSFDFVLKNLEISIAESQSLKLLSNSEIILLTGPPSYCYDFKNNGGCQNMTNSVCTPIFAFSQGQNMDFGECKCKSGTYNYPITETCTKIQTSLRFGIKVYGKILEELKNKAHHSFQLYKKAFDITLFDALYSDEPDIIGVSLIDINQDPNRKDRLVDAMADQDLKYLLDIYFGNSEVNQTHFIESFRLLMKKTKFPMFKDGSFDSINNLSYIDYMQVLKLEESLWSVEKTTSFVLQMVKHEPKSSNKNVRRTTNPHKLTTTLYHMPALNFRDETLWLDNTNGLVNSNLTVVNNSDFQNLLSSLLNAEGINNEPGQEEDNVYNEKSMEDYLEELMKNVTNNTAHGLNGINTFISGNLNESLIKTSVKEFDFLRDVPITISSRKSVRSQTTKISALRKGVTINGRPKLITAPTSKVVKLSTSDIFIKVVKSHAAKTPGKINNSIPKTMLQKQLLTASNYMSMKPPKLISGGAKISLKPITSIPAYKAPTTSHSLIDMISNFESKHTKTQKVRNVTKGSYTPNNVNASIIYLSSSNEDKIGNSIEKEEVLDKYPWAIKQISGSSTSRPYVTSAILISTIYYFALHYI
ncbi:unnamed protein product [Gordionus sp. m RMFG-2023]|uniref:uncharacterized protein LOC135926232 n=1 Tax=Gordionus sp. m RMFG-2023 TaxID=3053472 RepID=UPI0030DF0A13